jgi:CheY-like chemotaxis protein
MEKADMIEILLVEDNPSDVKLTLRALQKNNLANHVHVVNDGEEALDFIFLRRKYAARNVNDKIKLILLDLKLPKVDGLEVLKMIKSDERTKTIPVVILTSSREEKDVVESYRYGVNSYVVKPLDLDQFISSIAELGLYWMIINEPIR